jgi:hypothetical protein
MSFVGGIKWNSRNRPHGAKMAAVTYPPECLKYIDFPPPKNETATPSPGRFRPRQRGRQLIVMSLGGGIKWNSQNRPHGAKMAPVAHPPERLKYFDSPLLKVGAAFIKKLAGSKNKTRKFHMFFQNK